MTGPNVAFRIRRDLSVLNKIDNCPESLRDYLLIRQRASELPNYLRWKFQKLEKGFA
jgi:hypothetical protein